MRAVWRSIVLLGAVMLAASCTNAQVKGGDDRPKVAKIGFVTTLQDADAESGFGAKNSMELAIRQANQHNTVNGYTLTLVAKNDKADPAVGAKVAAELVADPQVVAVIDATYSGVSRATIPVLARSNMAQISAANTNPALTLGPFPTDAPKRVWPNYTRIVANDLLQGGFAADYVFDKAGIRRVATVNDNQVYGQGLVTVFERQWRRRGGQITSSNAVSESSRDFGEMVRRIVAQQPELVYYGGDNNVAIRLDAQLKQRGFRGLFMGADAMANSDFINGVGNATGSLATSVGEPVGKLDRAGQFITAYNAAGFGAQTYGAYGPLTYDATNILIQALSKVLPNADNVQAARPEVIRAINQTNGFEGVTGEHTFDQFGDTSNKALTIYRVIGGEWRDVFSGTFED